MSLHLNSPTEIKRMGTDEAGKGDYFGPLVIAAFCLSADLLPQLEKMGVKDSKELSDSKALELSNQIKGLGANSVVTIGPQKYNELYQKMKNLNRLLAWGHARAIENVLEQTDCPEVITDKFGDEEFVRQALLEKGRKVKLIQKTKAEEEPVVAAASILARAEFLKRLKMLSDEIGMELPKGASSLVDEAAQKLVAQKGENVLSRVAKLHFKNTQRVLCTKSS